MSSPFKALSPFAPRSIELNYAAFAPSCPEEPSFEAQLVVGDYLNNICGTNVDLGVLVGGSVHVINDILHSVGTLSVIIGTVQFTSDFSYTVLNNPSGKIIPCGQDTGLEFQFTVPSTPGSYAIFILIPSNDPLSPCTYGYTFTVAGGGPITYQWYGQDQYNAWHLLAGETNDTLDAYYAYNTLLYANFKCAVSCPSGIDPPTASPLQYTVPPFLSHYYFTAHATNNPSGGTVLDTNVVIIFADY